jgi:hypothetical protein
LLEAVKKDQDVPNHSQLNQTQEQMSGDGTAKTPPV